MLFTRLAEISVSFVKFGIPQAKKKYYPSYVLFCSSLHFVPDFANSKRIIESVRIIHYTPTKNSKSFTTVSWNTLGATFSYFVG